MLEIILLIGNRNMPQLDEYGTQQPIALLKQFLERGGIYDRTKELNWKHIKDIGFLASMGTIPNTVRPFLFIDYLNSSPA